MGGKELTPCYNPVSQVILCFTLMISELVFTLYWKNLIHTRISNPFLKCFLPSKSFFFSFFRLALSLLTTVNLQWQWILGPMQPSSHVPQHSNFKLKMNWKITGTFLCECTPSERQSGWVLSALARCLGCWPGAWGAGQMLRVLARCLGCWPGA